MLSPLAPVPHTTQFCRVVVFPCLFLFFLLFQFRFGRSLFHHRFLLFGLHQRPTSLSIRRNIGRVALPIRCTGAALSSLSEASNFIWAGRGRAVRGVLDRSLRRLDPSLAALLLIDFQPLATQGPTNPTTLEKRLVYNLKFGLNTHVLFFVYNNTHKDGMLPVLPDSLLRSRTVLMLMASRQGLPRERDARATSRTRPR